MKTWTPIGSGVTPGVIEELVSRGVEVLAPDRLRRSTSWVEDAGHLMRSFEALPAKPTVVVAGSNGCSTARFVDCVLDFVDLPLNDSVR